MAIVLAALSGAPAQAAASAGAATTSTCTPQTFTQAFAPWGDMGSYTLAPGQDGSGFNGRGWTLSGGAHITTTTLSGGMIGLALELPAGSHAVSPPICVASNYPYARVLVRNISGSNGGNVGFSVRYAGTRSWGQFVQTGSFKTTASAGVGGGWLLSGQQPLDPSNVVGWQTMQITLTPAGSKTFQVNDLQIDPRCR